MGQIGDVRQCVTMDFKQSGNILYLVGETKDELAGSHLTLVAGWSGGNVPQVDAAVAMATFAAIHTAITGGYVRACHDLSEGGLAVAIAEMAFAGGLGARVYLAQAPHQIDLSQFKERSGLANSLLLFSESNSRFLCEVPPDRVLHFEQIMGNVPHAAIGEVTANQRLQVIDFHTDNPDHVIDLDLQTLKDAWQRPLRME